MARGKRKTARYSAAALAGPEPRNESGASTVAGPSRARAAATPAHQYDDEVDDEVAEEEDEPVRLPRKRKESDRYAADGSPIATGWRKQPRKSCLSAIFWPRRSATRPWASR